MPKPAKQSVPARILAGGWSTGVFVIGFLTDVYCVMNVPGAAEFVATGGRPSASVTSMGMGLVLVSMAAWASVFIRVRYPLATAIAGGVLSLIGVTYLLLLIGAYQCAVRWPRHQWRVAAVSSALVLLFAVRESLTTWGGALLYTASEPQESGFTGTVTPFIIAILSLALVAGLVAFRRTSADAAHSRALAADEQRRSEELGDQVARQAERERIARDLHDGLGHRLSSAALTLGAIEAQVSAGVTPDPAHTRIAREQVHAALEDVRGVVGGLRSDIGSASLTPASIRLVGALVGDLRRAGHRLEAYVMVEGADTVPDRVDAAAYRILQESLTNAIKHAPGQVISVTFDAAPTRGIRIRVSNPMGTAGAPAAGGRNGILGIRERAAAVGGTAWIGPHEGAFLVDVTLPWETAA